MYICVTEVDAATKIVCTQEPPRTGPAMPAVKGFNPEWADKSTWPVALAKDGTYLRAPKYYGRCDDDADTSVEGVLAVLTESDYYRLKQAEYEARRPYASWLWDEDNGQWVSPIQLPGDAVFNGGNVAYQWDEDTVSWAAMSQDQ